MTTCVFLPCTINIDTNSSLYKKGQLTENLVREKQYLEGIQKIYQLNAEKNIDFYLSDNSDYFLHNHNHNLDSPIKIELTEFIKNSKIILITNVPNIYGKINKGSGLLEQWLHSIDIIKKYNWIIHFEPRQLLLSNQFIDSFIENPRNLFSYGGPYNTKDANSYIHFNTGLFSIESKLLIEFINGINLPTYKESIEYTFLNFFKNKNYTYDIIDKLDLLWHDSYSKKII